MLKGPVGCRGERGQANEPLHVPCHCSVSLRPGVTGRVVTAPPAAGEPRAANHRDRRREVGSGGTAVRGAGAPPPRVKFFTSKRGEGEGRVEDVGGRGAARPPTSTRRPRTRRSATAPPTYPCRLYRRRRSCGGPAS